MRKGFMEQHVNGQIHKATVVNVNIIQGRIQCDVIDINGNFYTGCEIINPGTGGANNYSNVSIEKNQEVIIILTGTATSPYILGTTFRSSVSGIQIDESVADNNKDYQNIAINNDFRKVGLNSLNITKNNGIILNSAQNIRLQMMLGGKLRISSAGQTIDNPLNGQQFIDELFSYINNLENRLIGTETVIKELLTALVATFSALEPAKKAYDENINLNPIDADATKSNCESTLNQKIELPK
jgi:hypothetical protein